MQLVSDFDLLRDEPAPPTDLRAAPPKGVSPAWGGPALSRFDAEFDLVEVLARAAGRPLSPSWPQRDPGGAQWQAVRTRVDAAVARGLPLYPQTAARGIGVLIGLEASFHPFMGYPGYKELADRPLAERAAAMREPARKARILAQKSERMAGDGTPVPPLVDLLLARIGQIAGRMFPLDEPPDCEPDAARSFLARARATGITALETLYDHLDTVHEMLRHPRALAGLGDAGAHVGTICDASFSTFMFTHWVRDRARGRLPRAQAVQMLSARNADYPGLADRGRIAPGQRADLNLIDPQRLAPGMPRLVHDLPGGSRRFLQPAEGYLATSVAGRCVQRDGRITDARPGRLVRMGR